MIEIRCERCGKSQVLNPDEIHNVPAALPDDWEEVRGKHLCNQCIRQLDRFLERQPIAGNSNG